MSESNMPDAMSVNVPVTVESGVSGAASTIVPIPEKEASDCVTISISETEVHDCVSTGAAPIPKTLATVDSVPLLGVRLPGSVSPETGSVSPDTNASFKGAGSREYKRCALQTKSENVLFRLLNLNPEEPEDMGTLEEQGALIWAKIELLMEINPSAFRRKYNFKAWQVGIHPLGMLCSLKASQELIQAAYLLMPKAANDAFAIAASFNADLTVLKWLYEQSPEVVSHEDPDSKNLPLHDACTDTLLRTIKFLCESHPAALVHKNGNGNTPLHFAFRWSSLAVVKYLITKSKEGVVKQSNDDNNTALHFAFLNENCEVAAFIMQKYPEFIKESRACDGWTPLHFVSRKGSNGYNAIKLLLLQFPEAAQMKDKNGMVPLVLACKNVSISVDALQLLFLNHPDAIDEVDEKGKPLVDHATSSKLLRRMATQLAQPAAKKRRTSNRPEIVERVHVG